MEKAEVKKTILSKALQKLLEESNVPYHQHVKVITALQQEVSKGREERDTHKKYIEKTQTQFDELHQVVEDMTKKHMEVLEHVYNLKQGLPGESVEGPAGKDGKNGVDAKIDHKLVVSEVLNLIRQPKDGKPGAPGKPADFNKEELFNEFLGLLRNNSLLDVTHIKGLQGWMRDGVKYRFEELMHGGGSSSSAGITVIAVIGTVDDTNVSFTVATTPKLVNINGAFYASTGGTYTWTYVGTTLTISSPIGSGGTIFALK